MGLDYGIDLVFEDQEAREWAFQAYGIAKNEIWRVKTNPQSKESHLPVGF